MTDTNQVVLVGRLTRDAELKYTTTGTAVCTVGLANNQGRKKEDGWVDEVSFFDVDIWGKTAESISKYLTKGKQIAVTGRLRQDRWENEGQSRSKVKVVANSVQLLGGQTGQPQPSPAGGPEAVGADSSGPPQDGFADDIPF